MLLFFGRLYPFDIVFLYFFSPVMTRRTDVARGIVDQATLATLPPPQTLATVTLLATLAIATREPETTSRVAMTTGTGATTKISNAQAAEVRKELKILNFRLLFLQYPFLQVAETVDWTTE